jgi:hypothetical protein
MTLIIQKPTGAKLVLAQTSYPDIRNGIVTNGLVLNLDAGQTASYSGSGTTWTDLSGNGNNGTLVNGPTYSSANGGSIVFNGTNNRISFVANPALAGSWSVGSFFNTSKGTFVQSIIGRTATAPNFEQNYNLLINVGKIQLFTSADAYTSVTSATLPINTWYFAVGTFNSATKQLSLYINGTLVDFKTLTVSSTPTTGSQLLQIAASDGTSPVNFFQGNIAQASVYNVALTAAEIQQNFNCLRMRYGI